MRIYESLGGKARGTLKCTLSVKKVWKCNLLEDDLEELKIKKGEVTGVLGDLLEEDLEQRKIEKGEVAVELKPFEVQTFRLQL